MSEVSGWGCREEVGCWGHRRRATRSVASNLRRGAHGGARRAGRSVGAVGR